MATLRPPAVVAVALVVVAAGAAALYLTRPAAAPSAPVEEPNSQLASAAADDELLFRFNPSNSRASYSLYEELREQPKTVVGVTAEVAGELALNLDQPARSRLGTFRVNARTLATDSERRDGAVARFILKSEEDGNEFITFVPSTLSSFGDSVTAGQPFTFRATGSLTIAGVTRAETFEVTATLLSNSQLLATATARVLRSSYGLTIPQVQSVANVGDEVTLKVTVDAVAEER